MTKDGQSKPSTPSIPVGSIVVFEQDGSSQLGLVTGHRKQLVLIFSMRAREYEFKEGRLHPIGLLMPAGVSSIAERQQFLSSLYERSNKISLGVEISEIWDLTKDDAQEVTSTELAKMYYGADISPEIYLSFRLALISDRVYFKRHEEIFSPRPQSVVDELRKQEAALAQKAAEREAVLKIFLERMKDQSVQIPDEASEMITNLEEVAAGVTEIEHSALRETKEFLNLIEEKGKIRLPEYKEGKAQVVLEKLGLLSPDSNLSVIRNRIPRKFSRAIRNYCESVQLNSSFERRDLRSLFMVTIDDVSTRDMDDALSLEPDGDGWCLGIHISDVASYVEFDGDLDREARRRATSIYIPGETINMFPDYLSDNVLSLVEGQDRAAISILVRLDRNFEILSNEIFPSLINVSKRMNYVEVDKLLADNDNWYAKLQQVAASYEGNRLARGANKLSKKEAILGPVVDGRVKVNVIDEDAPSRLIVSEMMILANELFADFARKHSLAIYFRGQSEPDEEKRQSALPPEGPARDFFLRTSLQKSIVSTSPSPHFALGLNAYCQATSPIRRYLDIVNQRQLISALNGFPAPFSIARLKEILDEVDPKLSVAQLVSKETRRFWLLRYIEERSSVAPILTGIVVRRDGKFPIIELEDVYATVIARLRPETTIGSRVGLRVVAVDARRDILKLEECTIPS